MPTFEESLDLEPTDTNQNLWKKLRNIVLRPFVMGLMIFTIFIAVVIVTKLFAFIISSNSIFSFSLYDIAFAMIGFGIGFIIDFSINLKRITIK